MEPTRIHGMEIAEGTVIEGRYEIRRKLGAGGFAQVFAAHDHNVEREVAIKFLDVHTGNRPPDQIENILVRFKREAKVAAQLGHPNVVNVYDFGIIEARGPVPYIVMEFLTGYDLETQLQKHGPLRARRAVELFIPCLEGLGEAHRKGIIHKDLKPANLFLVNPGERGEMLRLVDFGVAHFDNDPVAARLTATGEILGTPQYLPPEYINKQLVSPAFDVYQMGLILVEVISGQTVVNEANPFRCIMRHGQGDLDIPAPWLQTVLGPIIKKSLALDHEERYPDGYAMADALAAVDLSALPTPEKLEEWKESGKADDLRTSSEMLAGARLTGVATDALTAPGVHADPGLGFDQTVDGEGLEVAGRAGLTHPGGLGAVEEAVPPPPMRSVPFGGATQPVVYSEVDPGPRRQIHHTPMHHSPMPADVSAPIPVAGDSTQKGILAVLLAGVLLVLLILTAIVFVGRDRSEPTLPDAAAEQPAVVAPAAPAEPEPIVEKTPPVEEKPADPVMIRLEVEPANAQIFANTIALGRGSAMIQYAGPDDDPINFEIKAEGYETLNFTMGPDEGPLKQAKLTKIPEPTPAPKTTSRPPRESTTKKAREAQPKTPPEETREFLVVP